MTTAKDTEYEPDPQTALALRPVDTDLDAKITGQAAVDSIATALRNAAFEFDQDDLITIATAETLKVVDADEYVRGYELLHELGAIETRVTTHYNRFDKPLNFLVGVVRKLKKPQADQVTPVKQALSKRLGTWKADQTQRDSQERQRLQAIADAAAKEGQLAKAASLQRVAQTEPDPALAASFENEAAMVRAVDVHAAPVNVKPGVPLVPGGYTRAEWSCEFVDLKELLKAYVEGRCFLDEDAIKEGLQASMDQQASNLQQNLEKAFPGTKAVPSYGAVARKR